MTNSIYTLIFPPTSAHINIMLLIFIRSTITFLLLLIIMRLMGKRQIGEMQPFEFVITLVISDLACLPLTDVSIPLLYGIISIISLLAFHQVVAFINKKSLNMRKIICGRPSIVITPAGIDFKELKSLDMSISDLLEAMRNSGYFSFDEIQYGIFETNGNFSVLENKNVAKNKNDALPLTLIEEGKIVSNTLKMLNLTKDWVKSNLVDYKKMLVATIDKNGEMYIQRKRQKVQNIKVKI